MSASLLGMVLGAVAAAGLLMVVTFAPPFRAVRLVDRLAPYVHDTPPPSRLLGTAILLIGGAVCAVAYRLMLRIGRLPEDVRVLQ